jgi:hypothetical protein
MTTNMRISHTTESIEDFLASFAGREGIAGYDATKLIKIAEENRDFVWDDEMCKDLIMSIFGGYSIPLMVICDNRILDGGNRSTALMMWKQNKFEVTVGDWTGRYNDMTPALIAKWNRCLIPVTKITGATREERCKIYENYNKGKVLTFGHKLKNRKSLPLVKKAYDLLGWAGAFPFASLIHQAWKRSWRQNKTLNQLAFAYSVIVASMIGSDQFHTKFELHLERMLATGEDQIDLSNLRFICEVVVSADPDNRISPKKKEQVFKKFIGAMIYDVWRLERSAFAEKWKAFVEDAYTILTKEQLSAIIDVGTARATNTSRIQCLAQKVAEYLVGVVPIGNDNATEYSDDSEDDSEDI